MLLENSSVAAIAAVVLARYLSDTFAEQKQHVSSFLARDDFGGHSISRRSSFAIELSPKAGVLVAKGFQFEEHINMGPS